MKFKKDALVTAAREAARHLEHAPEIRAMLLQALEQATAPKARKGNSVADLLGVSEYAKQITAPNVNHGYYWPTIRIADGCDYADMPCLECELPLGDGKLGLIGTDLAHAACYAAYWDRHWDAVHARGSKPSVKIDLSLCACGHGPDRHKKDKLENLLECTAWITSMTGRVNRACSCDHFHYDVDAAETAQAA